MRRRHGGLMAAGLTAVSLAAVLASIGVGSESISFAAAWRDWCAGRPLADAPELAILLQHRLPRTLAALFAGGGLALAGCVFQALLRNPLATPYTLGVASAGAFGAYTATVVMRSAGLALALWGFSAVQVFAFVFALLDVSLIYLMAVRRHHVSSSVLLLAGITLGMLSNAGMMLVRFLSEPGMLAMMERWLMGGVDVMAAAGCQAGAGVLPCSAVLLLQAAKFDQLGFSRGCPNAQGERAPSSDRTFLLGSFLTAVIVSEWVPSGSWADRAPCGAQPDGVAPPPAAAAVVCGGRRCSVCAISLPASCFPAKRLSVSSRRSSAGRFSSICFCGGVSATGRPEAAQRGPRPSRVRPERGGRAALPGFL